MVRITIRSPRRTVSQNDTLRLAAVDNRSERMQLRVRELDSLYRREHTRLAAIIKKARDAI